MKSWIVCCAAILIFASSCTNDSKGYKTAKSGMGYKIFSGGGKDSIKPGNAIRFRIIQKIEDSLLMVIEETPDQFKIIDSIPAPFDPFEIVGKMAVGDSAVCRFSVDSILKMNANAPPGQLPAFLKKGKNIYVTIKILKKYNNPQDANPDYTAENERMQKIFIRKDSLNAIKSDAEFAKIAKEKFAGSVKTEGGTLVKIIKQGTGAACDSGKLISMKYEGRFTDGIVFDGNMNATDPSKAKTLDFVLGVDPMMKGWNEGIRLLRVGTVAKFFIPYSSGYGLQQYQQIPGGSNLMFDVEVVDVKTAPPRPAQQMAPQQQKQPRQ